MDMKKLINIVNEGKINECDMQPAMPHQPPVSMNVSLNAQGIDQIKDLLNLMHHVDHLPPAPVPAVGFDMPLTVSSAKDQDPLDKIIKTAGLEPSKEKPKEEYANRPDEKVSGIDAAIPDGDDLHRSKQQFAKAQDGDNPMAVESIRAMLDARYKEIKESNNPFDVKNYKSQLPTKPGEKAGFDSKKISTGTVYSRKPTKDEEPEKKKK